jgi:hypothetical protein
VEFLTVSAKVTGGVLLKRNSTLSRGAYETQRRITYKQGRLSPSIQYAAYNQFVLPWRY